MKTIQSRNKREGRYAGKDFYGHVRTGTQSGIHGYSKCPAAHTVELVIDGKEKVECSGSGCGGKYGRPNFDGSQYYCGGSDRCCP